MSFAKLLPGGYLKPQGDEPENINHVVKAKLQTVEDQIREVLLSQPPRMTSSEGYVISASAQALTIHHVWKFIIMVKKKEELLSY